MPFQKGQKPFNKKKSVEVSPESVSQEMQPSAPEWDEIVPKAPELPAETEKEIVIPQIPTEDEVDFGGIHGWNMAELEFMDVNLNKTPKPPRCVQEWCKRNELEWRWLSYPGVKNYGMRGYVALSVTPELRKRIKKGDCPATIDIDVSNKLVWREDAFLGVIPKRLAEIRRKTKQQKIMEQTKLAKGVGAGLQDMARRAGGKLVEYSIEETIRQGL